MVLAEPMVRRLVRFASVGAVLTVSATDKPVNARGRPSVSSGEPDDRDLTDSAPNGGRL